MPRGRATLPLVPAQCRAARAVLGLSQAQLAEAAGVSRPTVGLFENGARAPHPVSIVAIRTALETAGLRFIAENGGGPGLRRRESKGNPVALPLTSEQCRAARAMLNLSRGDLAKAASVAVYLVARFELDQFEPLSRALAAIRAALEKAGVEFIEENGGGPGVRLSKQPGGL